MKSYEKIAISELHPYERNARTHSDEQLKAIGNSITEFGFINPVIIDENNMILVGHGRVEAAKQIGITEVPILRVPDLTEDQKRAYILADNKLSDMGGWDFNILMQELDEIRLDMSDFGFELNMEDGASWFNRQEKDGTARQEGNEEYNAFLDKFEQPKTTDDCYTPDNIYDVIADWVASKYNVDRKNFVRPFYPGGDYQNMKYKSGCVVVDNPPFSILAEIVDFYVDKNISFFLFAPALSLLGYSTRKNVCCLCAYCGITYENGACVQTGFITNLGDGSIAAMSAPDLFDIIERENTINEKQMKKVFQKYEYPYEVITSAKLGWIGKYGQQLEIRRDESVLIRAMDEQKEKGVDGIFGSALLMSERAAAERAAAERAAAKCWQLSEREREIIRKLGDRDD